MEENIKVYVLVDINNIITQINSEIFITNINGWKLIDEGLGDRYVHAQGNYFPVEKPITDEQSRYNYKLVDGNVIELTNEEKGKLFPTQAPQPSQEEILRANLLKDNVAFKLQLAQQQKINANLLTQIAKLGGTE